MYREFYQCDDCGDPLRRITINKADSTELHFCSLGCLECFIGDNDPEFGIYVRAEDIRDGA